MKHFNAAVLTVMLGVWLNGLVSVDGADMNGGPMPSTRRAQTNQPREQQHGVYLSPVALAATADGKTLFIACATAERVLVFDIASGSVAKTIPVPNSPSGLTLSPDGRKLFVTCSAPESRVWEIDVALGKVTRKMSAGHTAMSPVCSPDGKQLFVCNRFNDCITAIDLAKGKEICRIKVAREPVSQAITPDGKFLFAANHIHAGTSDADYVASCVSVIDLSRRQVVKEIKLPSGSTVLRDIRVSPDGKYACVTHVLARFHLPTTQIERGWINNNALSIIDVTEQKLLNTVLLDNIDSGAANPWSVAWTADGRKICVTHAGTHELSVIEVKPLLAKLAQPVVAGSYSIGGGTNALKTDAANVPNDLAFLVGLRQRIKINQKGPRALAFVGSTAYIGNYFSDSISVVDLQAQHVNVKSISLGGKETLSLERQGELNFNDATLCFQGWQTCASCHSSDGRVDGLNWDLLNDGIGNPKNAKSLLLANLTAPLMSLAVRTNLHAAVRAGFRYIQFLEPSAEDLTATEAYLRSLQPMPSPFRANGKLSKSAERGKKIYMDQNVRCASCHPQGIFTDLQRHNVGTSGKYDKVGENFDTPTLVEVWRTAPYLHDGSAATMREVLTTRNKGDQHGKTSHLSEEQIDDLLAYILSL